MKTTNDFQYRPGQSNHQQRFRLYSWQSKFEFLNSAKIITRAMRHVNPMYQKGDVVLVSMPEQSLDGLLVKRRPAVIVSSNIVNQAMVVPLIADTAQRKNLVHIAMNSSEGVAAGLRIDSSVDCSVIATVPTALIVAKIPLRLQ